MNIEKTINTELGIRIECPTIKYVKIEMPEKYERNTFHSISRLFVNESLLNV